MTKSEIKVLEDRLNYWQDAVALAHALDEGSKGYIERSYARINQILEIIDLLGLRYQTEPQRVNYITVKYTRTHYTVFSD